MAKGDYNWASQGIARDLGPRWTNDKMGHVLLWNGYYQSRMSPDIREKYQDSFQTYMQKHYKYDFGDMFDWNAYRRFYNAARGH